MKFQILSYLQQYATKIQIGLPFLKNIMGCNVWQQVVDYNMFCAMELLHKLKMLQQRIEGIRKCATTIGVWWEEKMIKEKIGAQNDGECHHFWSVKCEASLRSRNI